MGLLSEDQAPTGPGAGTNGADDGGGVPASTDVQRWTLVLASVASVMVALDLLVVATALTTIRADLGASVVELQWTVTGYGLAFAGLLLAGAALGDRFGRRRVFAVGLAVFVVASAACALAGSVEVLIAARLVQGAGAALTMPVALTLVSAAYPAATRGRAIGILEGVTGLATIGGPIVGGAIAAGLAWEWIFWLNVPIGALAAVLALVKLEESHGSDTALDVPAVVLVSGGALGVVWALVRGNAAGWTSAETLVAATAGLVMLAAFVAWETRPSEPMLPLRLFGSRAFSAPVAAGFLGFAALYGAVFFLSQFMQTGLGHDPLTAGLLLVPWTATLLVVAPLAAALGDRLGERRVVIGGLATQAAGLAALALLAAPDVAYWQLLVPFLVTGVGTSMMLPVVQGALLGAVAPDELGKASGVNTMAQELGGALGVAVLVAVFTATGGYASAAAFTDGFVDAMAVCAALAGAGAVAALAMPPRPGRTGPD